MSDFRLADELRGLDGPVEPDDHISEEMWMRLAQEFEGPHSRSSDQTRLGRGVLVAAVAAIVVVAAILPVVFFSGGGGPVGSSDTTSSQPSLEQLPEGVVELPASHPARQLIEEAESYGDFNRRARESLVVGANVDFWACSLSGVGVCYVIADGIVAVAVFDAPRGAVAVVTGPGVDGEVTIPLNTGVLLGVESDSTAINVSVRDSLGTELVGVGSDWDAPDTTFSIALGHPLMQEAQRISSAEIFTDDLRAVINPQPSDQLYRVPIPETDNDLLVRLRPGAPPHTFATACSVLVLGGLPAGWEGTCLELSVEGDRQLGEFTFSDAVDAATQQAGPIELPPALPCTPAGAAEAVEWELTRIRPDLEIRSLVVVGRAEDGGFAISMNLDRADAPDGQGYGSGPAAWGCDGEFQRFVIVEDPGAYEPLTNQEECEILSAEVVPGFEFNVCWTPTTPDFSNRSGGDTRIVELLESAMAVTLPSEWHVADVNLTPNLSSPVEVLSVGSFPLNPGGPNCAQIPSRALQDMGATDVFVTVQEAGPGAGFEPRPDTFGPTAGSGDNVFLDCVGQEEQDDIGELHWLSFTDQDRYFYAAVAIGKDAAQDDVSAIWSVLDKLVIAPRE